MASPSCLSGLTMLVSAVWIGLLVCAGCSYEADAFVPFVANTLSRKNSLFSVQLATKWAESSLSMSSRDENSSDDSSELAPIPKEWQGDVLGALSSVIDPDLNADIVTLGFVKNLSLNGRKVSFDVELTTPACPVKEQFATECEGLINNLPWTSGVDVTMTAQPTAMDTESIGMAQVGAVIAVSSCKGGVGKSTTAVNLAFALQSLGATVGIFDADVYGPSLPTMVTPDDDNVRFVGRQIAPLQRNGVRLMSFGYINEGSAVMRGPMITQLLDQFMSVTNWGPLDYLILDMPPGTGDIQLTLTQRLNITAAVIVTTPQELSYADVVRGIEMFDTVNVPCVAVVENMAYYEVDSAAKLDTSELKDAFVSKLNEAVTPTNGDKSTEELAEELVQIVQQQQKPSKERVNIFGPGHKKRLSDQWGIEHTFSLPLMDRIAANGDSGTPYILENSGSSQADIFHNLAESVVVEVAKAKFSGSDGLRPAISYNEEKQTVEVDGEFIGPAALRGACRCAACVEEMTGRQILDPRSIPDSIRPLNMAPCGNYAHSIDWSDGHRSLYPYRQIRSLISSEDGAREKIVL